MREPGDLLGPMRLPFLVLPPVCVALGAGTALWTEGTLDVLNLILAFVECGRHIPHPGCGIQSDSGLEDKMHATVFGRLVPGQGEPGAKDDQDGYQREKESILSGHGPLISLFQ